MKGKHFRLVSIFMTVFLIGFSLWSKEGEEITFDKLPKAIQESFNQIAEGAKILEIELEIVIGENKIYEINADLNGTKFAYIFSDDGTLLELEEVIEFVELPAFAQKVIQEKFPEIEVKMVEAIQANYFEVKGIIDGKVMELKVLNDGTIEVEEDADEEID